MSSNFPPVGPGVTSEGHSEPIDLNPTLTPAELKLLCSSGGTILGPDGVIDPCVTTTAKPYPSSAITMITLAVVAAILCATLLFLRYRKKNIRGKRRS